MKNDKKKVVLNEKLNEVLDTIGESPFDEPEIFKAVDLEKPRKVEAVTIALTRKSLDLKDFTAKEIADFFSAMRNKIIALKDADGNYKVTPATKNYRFPNFEEVEKFSDLGSELNELYTRQSDLPEDEYENNANKIIAVLTEMDNVLWEVTQLDRDKLTPWEIKLISEQIFAYTTEVENTSMGKPLDI